MQDRPPRRRAALAVSIAIAATPLAAAAQPADAAWAGDICQPETHAAGARGGPLGALFTGLFGWMAPPAPHPSRRAVEAGAPQCLTYPPRVETHQPNCRWVQDVYGGAAHQFEVCRESDGVWRPSGRS